MSPVFGRFGRRRDDPGGHEPDPWLDDPVPARDPSEHSEGHPSAAERSKGHPSAAERSEGHPSAARAAINPARAAMDPAPATRSASPALWGPRRPAAEDEIDTTVDDPVTDPFGFPPIPPVLGPDPDRSPADPVPTWAAWVPPASGPSIVAVPAAVPPAEHASGSPPAARDPRPSGSGGDPRTRADATPPAPTGAGHDDAAPDGATAGTDVPDDVPAPPTVAAPVVLHAADPDVAEAAALAAAFAADYLSWDEDDPARRGRALADHLPGPAADRALLGWAGTGRQRAEIVLPGAVRPDGDDRFLVDVRVRVTPYRRVSRSEPAPEPEPGDALGTPAAAPPVTARGWRGLAARWVRLGVTVGRDGDRLVVDVGEETTDDGRDTSAPVRTQAQAVVEDPTLDADEADEVVPDAMGAVTTATGSRR